MDDPPGDHFPGHGAIAGFLKSLAQEWPAVRVKGVDISMTAPGTVAGWLRAELMAEDGIVEVGYRDGRRMLLELVPAPLVGPWLATTRSRFGRPRHRGRPGNHRRGRDEAGGGLSAHADPGRAHPPPAGPEPVETAGLNEPREIKRALIERHRREGSDVTPAIIEEGCRRLLNEREVRANLERLGRSGARVEYRPCDVRDPAEFGALIDDVYRTHGRIDGVIHGAGVIEDQLIRNKRLDSFERVFGTKVESALVLAAKLRPEALRFLVLFGSVSGRFGNRGQADYAAASEVLNKLAQDLDRRWPARVVSINWGPWLTTGMVTPEVQRQFAERGVDLIPIDVGCRMLDEELRRSDRQGEAEVVIGGARGLGGAVRGPARVPRRTRAPGVRSRACPSWATAARSIDARTDASRSSRTLDLARDLYLRDHRLDGRPVLPFAVAMELMAEVAAAGWPDREVVAAPARPPAAGHRPRWGLDAAPADRPRPGRADRGWIADRR